MNEDDAVERALLQRALGYDYEETTEITVMDKGRIVSREVRKHKRHLPPDLQAIRFWLTNRKPNEWKERPELAEGDSATLMRLDTLLAEVRAVAEESC